MSKPLKKKTKKTTRATATRAPVKKTTTTTKKLKKTSDLAKRRVAIAKDVIARILAKRIVPVFHTTYLSIDRKKALQAKSKKISPNKAVQGKVLEECTVCALGSFFVSEIDKNNEVFVRHLEEDSVSDDLAAPSTLVFERLGEIFDSEQMNLIEGCFEGGRFGSGFLELTGPDQILAEDFHNLFPGPNTCLLAICRNIIANNGTFKPAQEVKEYKLLQGRPNKKTPQQQLLSKRIQVLSKWGVSGGDVEAQINLEEDLIDELLEGISTLTLPQWEDLFTRLDERIRLHKLENELRK